MRPSLAALLAATTLTLAACSGGDTVDLGPVRESIDLIESAQEDLRSRMTGIEDSVTALGSTSGGDPEAAAELIARLDTIEQALNELQSTFSQFQLDTDATETELRDLLAQLDSTLSGVTTSLASIRTDLADARSRLNSLEAQFEEHERSHNNG